MRGDDQRRARGERGEEACGREKVRVDDIGPESSRGAEGVAGEREVTPAPSCAARHDGPVEFVAAGDQLAFEVGDERTEVGVGLSRVHLRYEQDPHVERL